MAEKISKSDEWESARGGSECGEPAWCTTLWRGGHFQWRRTGAHLKKTACCGHKLDGANIPQRFSMEFRSSDRDGPVHKDYVPASKPIFLAATHVYDSVVLLKYSFSVETCCNNGTDDFQRLAAPNDENAAHTIKLQPPKFHLPKATTLFERFDVRMLLAVAEMAINLLVVHLFQSFLQ
uniref:ZP domain-containing protein n=1 Tax=Heterorhabditis bacteriophora TaxID=37862 RepID=A0A1I7XAQ2_HETBA